MLTQENILVLVLDFSSYETITFLPISLSLPSVYFIDLLIYSFIYLCLVFIICIYFLTFL